MRAMPATCPAIRRKRARTLFLPASAIIWSSRCLGASTTMPVQGICFDNDSEQALCHRPKYGDLITSVRLSLSSHEPPKRTLCRAQGARAQDLRRHERVNDDLTHVDGVARE